MHRTGRARRTVQSDQAVRTRLGRNAMPGRRLQVRRVDERIVVMAQDAAGSVRKGELVDEARPLLRGRFGKIERRHVVVVQHVVDVIPEARRAGPSVVPDHRHVLVGHSAIVIEVGITADPVDRDVVVAEVPKLAPLPTRAVEERWVGATRCCDAARLEDDIGFGHHGVVGDDGLGVAALQSLDRGKPSVQSGLAAARVAQCDARLGHRLDARFGAGVARRICAVRARTIRCGPLSARLGAIGDDVVAFVVHAAGHHRNRRNRAQPFHQQRRAPTSQLVGLRHVTQSGRKHAPVSSSPGGACPSSNHGTHSIAGCNRPHSDEPTTQ